MEKKDMSIKTITVSILGAAILVATLFVTKPWAQPAGDRSIVSQTPSPIVSPAPRAFPEVSLEDLRGIDIPELTYLEDGALYRSKPNDPNERATRKKVAEGVYRILDEKDSTMLFTKKNEKFVEFSEMGGEDLWILDAKTGVSQMVYPDVMLADMSPQGDIIAVGTYETFELHLITSKGVLLKKIGVHGSGPLFSPDGKYLVYNKLADAPQSGQGLDWNYLLENAQGLALYDVKAGTERMLTSRAGDFQPFAFSPDMKRVYFNADDDILEMKGKNGIWSVTFDGKNRKQLTNTPITQSLPYLDMGENSSALWSKDGLTAITEFNGSIWRYRFSFAGDILDGDILIQGAKASHWIVQDSIIGFREGSRWNMLKIQK